VFRYSRTNIESYSTSLSAVPGRISCHSAAISPVPGRMSSHTRQRFLLNQVECPVTLDSAFPCSSSNVESRSTGFPTF